MGPRETAPLKGGRIRGQAEARQQGRSEASAYVALEVFPHKAAVRLTPQGDDPNAIAYAAIFEAHLIASFNRLDADQAVRGVARAGKNNVGGLKGLVRIGQAEAERIQRARRQSR